MTAFWLLIWQHGRRVSAKSSHSIVNSILDDMSTMRPANMRDTLNNNP